MPGGNVGVLTYNGLDGACAGASVLLKYPDARLIITSAKRVTRSLESVLEGPTGPLERLDICGLGVRGDWEGLRACGERLKRSGIETFWYCGRGYLDRWRDRFSSFCTPVFTDAGTNTGAVCRHLGLTGEKRGRELMELALLDPNLRKGKDAADCADQQRFWVDLVEAAISQYFKYQEQQAYINTIRALASGQAGEGERQLVAVYRRHGGEHALRGNSRQMEQLRERIRRVAKVDEHVIITGESGVGKEYVARLLHEAGRRTMDPISTVNCAVFAGNEALANSVLFGHVRGAFTGASEDREGAFVAADGGMLFLDEVGELPLSVQGKLLRVIEDGWVTPVGRDSPIGQVDVRVIAATNRNLSQMINNGSFREDLFHRLDALRLDVPPLRRRREDIVYIAEYLLRNIPGCEARRKLSEGEKAALESYHWPGNVRQLRKVLKRSRLLDLPMKDVIGEEQRYLQADDATQGLLPACAEDITDIRRVQHEYAKRACSINGGNISDTARRLKVSPNTLKKYLGRFPDRR